MTRKDDEKTLRMLDLHRRGHSHAAIARATASTHEAVRKRIAAVRTADCDHDPEARHWWRNIGDPTK